MVAKIEMWSRIVILALLGDTLLLCQTLLVTEDVNKVKFQVMIEPKASFYDSGIEPFAKSFLKINSEGFRVLSLLLATNGMDAQVASFHPHTDILYADWLELRQRSLKPFPVAEIVAFGNSAVLRVRDAHGSISKHVIRGSDLLVFQVNQRPCEVLHIAPLQQRMEDRLESHDEAGLQVYLRIKGALDLEFALDVWKALSRRTGIKNLSIRIRNDAWFAGDASFAVVYPFDSISDPPSLQGWANAPRAWCFPLPTGVRCGSSTGGDEETRDVPVHELEGY
jgi:hypothetical protein